MTFARTSIALLAIQLAIVSSIAAKYLYQRHACPRVWTRAVAFDPEMVMRGRYLSTQLKIDACGINLPLTHDNPVTAHNPQVYFDLNGDGSLSSQIPIVMGVKNGKLVAERIANPREEHNREDLILHKGATCSDAVLQKPVDFFLAETAKSPFPLEKGQELWVEVTIPPIGPPRPLGLAIKSSDGRWQALNYR